ncbi:unnamed protein product, partial [Allacma fusca]
GSSGGAIGQDIVLQENGRGAGVQAISWASCGGDATVGQLNLDGCSSAGCTLKLYQGYQANFPLRLNRTQNSSTIEVTANNGPNIVLLPRQILNGTFQAGVNYSISFPVYFDSRFASNRTNTSFTIRVEVIGNGVGRQLTVCRTFPIVLNSRVNNGTSYNQKCDINNEPCAFANSLCKSGSCKCNSNFVENSNQCKAKVDKACFSSGDCLKNAECKSGLCKCQNGYKPNKDNDKCSSGSTAISFSVLLLALQQLFLFIRK